MLYGKELLESNFVNVTKDRSIRSSDIQNMTILKVSQECTTDFYAEFCQLFPLGEEVVHLKLIYVC